MIYITKHQDPFHQVVSTLLVLYGFILPPYMDEFPPIEIFEKWLFAKINPRGLNFKTSSAMLEIGMK